MQEQFQSTTDLGLVGFAFRSHMELKMGGMQGLMPAPRSFQDPRGLGRNALSQGTGPSPGAWSSLRGVVGGIPTGGVLSARCVLFSLDLPRALTLLLNREMKRRISATGACA